MAVDRFPVEEGSILLFARAIGDPNPERGVAPPTFIQSSAQFDPDYPLLPKPGEKWFGSGREPSGVTSSGSGSGGVGLHAEQHFEYHRPLRVGDVLTSTTRAGEGWEKEGRSGKLVFSEAITEYRDAAGELVVTARSVGVLTQRKEA